MKIDRFGYAKQPFVCSELNFQIRPDTSDESIINEVLVRNVYQKKKINFLVEPNDVWLDLGANIGAFSVLALAAGGQVVAVEPEPENLDMLASNLELNFDGGYEILPHAVNTEDKAVDLYLCQTQYNKSRHTLFPKKGRQAIQVDGVSLDTILNTYPEVNAIKMDIEGSEIPILEQLDFSLEPQIRKLVFEYSFDIDRSISRFMSIIKKLEGVFSVVHYTKVKPDEEFYTYYPPCVNVFCHR